MSTSLHSNLTLYISDQSYSLHPANNNSQARSLSIDRSDSRISLAPPGPPPKFDRSVSNVAGIFGIIRLLKSDYLILIQSARKLTTLFNTPVYTPTKFSVYPISLESNLNLLADSNERYLLSILKSHLDHAISRTFFSYHPLSNSATPNDPPPWDLTHSLQRQLHPRSSDQKIAPAPWNQADDRFFWNKFLHASFINLASQPDHHQASKFILPVIFGFLQFKTTTIKGKNITFGIISRRSRHRAGTRYFSRGMNSEGDVSNFNETEMIMTTVLANHAQGDPNPKPVVRASFVQTRGSVPLFWTEINTLRYRPDLKIIDTPQSLEAIKAHFDRQVDIYGDQYLLNLVNSSGYEKPVKESYEKGVRNLNNPRVHYTYFDFHKECKGLRFDRVQKLLDQLHDQMVDQGYFFKQSTSAPSKTQKSVFRTNCMDCLDRTNVVQSALAKWVLTLQLKDAGVLSDVENLDLFPDFMYLFRNLWADNADAISTSYSGTPALKTDFTRLGIRTKKGALDDVINSVMRYIKNNYLDGPRQDSYDLVTGAWVPPSSTDSDHTSHPKSNHPLSFRGPYDNYYLQAIALSFLISLLVFISATFTKKRSMKLSLVSLILVGLIGRYILRHGREFVNEPRLAGSATLVARQRIVEFTGPSSRAIESSRHGREKIDYEQLARLAAWLTGLLRPAVVRLRLALAPKPLPVQNSKLAAHAAPDDDRKKRRD